MLGKSTHPKVILKVLNNFALNAMNTSIQNTTLAGLGLTVDIQILLSVNVSPYKFH